jgi:pSer/pThr/pTyr-binding forkhead associated (FHA) protein
MVRFILRGLTHPLEHELHSGVITIGRSPSNEFLVADSSVSSVHAQVTVDPSGPTVRVKDLQSTNGTFIDASPVEESVLRPGQTLQLGGVELRLDIEEFEIRIPTAAASPAPAQPVGIEVILEDGTRACSRNPALPATHEAELGCMAVVKCPAVFHASSLRVVKLSGGKAGVLLFCPDCNTRCRPIPGASDADSKKKSLLSRLTQTVHLGWKKK